MKSDDIIKKMWKGQDPTLHCLRTFLADQTKEIDFYSLLLLLPLHNYLPSQTPTN